MTSRNRFKVIGTFLHFVDSTDKDTFNGVLTLYRIFPKISHVNKVFQKMFTSCHVVPRLLLTKLWHCPFM